MTGSGAGSSAAGGLLGAIADVGRASSGGYERFAWTVHDLALREWFAAEAAARGLDVTTDRAGNQWAWWGDPDADGPGVVTGSHLDSVPGGGAFDGPLGVVSAFAALDALRASGVVPARPLAIVNFSDEEGARFGLACLGSRAVTGTVSADRLLALRDRTGDSLADVLGRVSPGGSGVSSSSRGSSLSRPGEVSTSSTSGVGVGVGGSGSWGSGGVSLEHYGRDDEALARIGVFVELHVEQGRYLADLPADEAAPVAVGAAIWPHGRWRVDLAGEANHAGTTPLAHRHDPMLDLARLITDVRAAAEQAGALATLAKVEVEPNGVNAIPSRVRAWIDARAETEDAVLAVLCGPGGVGGAVPVEAGHMTAGPVAERVPGERPGLRSSAPGGPGGRGGPGTGGGLGGSSGSGVFGGLGEWAPVEESWTPATVFDPALAARLADVVGRPGSDLPAPVIGTGAGHDAGILAAAGVPTAMLFVRNPTGVSHSPAEHAEQSDCDAGVEALTAVLADLLTTPAVPLGRSATPVARAGSAVGSAGSAAPARQGLP
ncbi:hypothetical protein GCM10010413_38180 [Promicromonospora sukumoe]|uniref:N-carbamoyl-L-amino-acid hydrolase n=1 Tax=Promicromonospora sukumoe TaxID=88382 RepID=A0A7W3PF62_9MICO|nr:Zn-dependent hydrolase [Promicromonospora sukumoe]MBA8809608.1 N-carbamoyl-L-amino-acid hydrolase [Promicromonospora sukumoe]